MKYFNAFVYGIVAFFLLTFLLALFQTLAEIRDERRTNRRKPIFRLGPPLMAFLLMAGTSWAQTNPPLLIPPPTNVSVLNPTVPPPALPALSGIAGVIANQLVDDVPYITNGSVSVDLAALYNASNPKGTGHMGMFGDVLFPVAKQGAVGIGGGEMAHHSFISPVAITLGTTLTNLPAILGKWYAYVADGPLYDFTGKEVGNWACSGFFHNWTVSQKVNIGLKLGVYDDSVIPGIGYFAALTGTF